MCRAAHFQFCLFWRMAADTITLKRCGHKDSTLRWSPFIYPDRLANSIPKPMAHKRFCFDRWEPCSDDSFYKKSQLSSMRIPSSARLLRYFIRRGISIWIVMLSILHAVSRFKSLSNQLRNMRKVSPLTGPENLPLPISDDTGQHQQRCYIQARFWRTLAAWHRLRRPQIANKRQRLSLHFRNRPVDRQQQESLTRLLGEGQVEPISALRAAANRFTERILPVSCQMKRYSPALDSLDVAHRRWIAHRASRHALSSDNYSGFSRIHCSAYHGNNRFRCRLTGCQSRSTSFLNRKQRHDLPKTSDRFFDEYFSCK
jgi:hypothetical protein